MPPTIDFDAAIVTGSSGVVGQELLKILRKNNIYTLGIDRVWPEIVPDKFLHVDLNRFEVEHSSALYEFLDEYESIAVFHLAASFERTDEDVTAFDWNFRDNILATHRFLKHFGSANVSRFIFASSYLIYDPSTYMDSPHTKYINEEYPINPRNLVGTAKLFNEREISHLMSEYGVPTTHARIFRVYGNGSRDVIGRMIRISLQGETFNIYNPDWRVGYIHACDVADGLFRLAKINHDGVVNLGNGWGNSIVGVVAEVGKIKGSELLWDSHEPMPVENSACDVGLLERLTGWSPRTPLADGIELVIKYERERLSQCQKGAD